MNPSLQTRLVQYLKKHPLEKIAKGTLADLAREKMGVTGESVGRRLRIMVEVSDWGYRPTDSPEHHAAFKLLDGGKMRVEYREKRHAWYWYEPSATRQVREVVVEGGVAREIIRTINT